MAEKAPKQTQRRRALRVMIDAALVAELGGFARRGHRTLAAQVEIALGIGVEALQVQWAVEREARKIAKAVREQRVAAAKQRTTRINGGYPPGDDI